MPVKKSLVRRCLYIAAICTTIASQSFAQGGDPCAPIVGSGDTVFSSAPGDPTFPDVALFGDGSGVLIWRQGQSPGNDNDRTAVVGQMVDTAGNTTGAPFQLNTYIVQDQLNPAVGAAADGRFVGVWQSDTSPGDVDGSSIRGRVYRANGTPLGPDFRINNHTAGNQTIPQVSMANDGSFVAVWTSTTSPGNDNSGLSVQARRYNANGTPKGAQFQVNSRTSSTQNLPDVASYPDGRFVVAFSSNDSSGSDNGTSIQVRRYSSSGQPLGAELQANVTTQGSQTEPSIAIDADGTYMVAWQSAESAGSDNNGRSIQARGFLANGVAAGAEVQVNTRIFSHDEDAQVAAVGGREFLVVWKSPLEGASAPEVRARALTLETQFLGFAYTVSTGSQHPAVGGNRAGVSLIASRKTPGGGIVGHTYSHPCATGGGVTTCTQNATTLCLNNDRFKVTLTWRTVQGDTGVGNAVELTPDSGFFTIFDPSNVEVIIKVLNACGFTNSYWAFISGLTDIEINMVVEDTMSSEVRFYTNPLGTPFELITDFNAFSTCP